MLLLLSLVLGASAQLYLADPAWKPAFPAGAHTYSGVAVESGVLYVTQRGNTSLSPVLAMDTRSGALLEKFGEQDVGKSPDGDTWGAHGIAATRTAAGTRIYIDDFDAHVLTAFERKGAGASKKGSFAKSLQLGTWGKPDNGTDPVQFGNLADTAIGASSTALMSRVYVSDGDGGSANRVIALDVSDLPFCTQQHRSLHDCASVVWATPAAYHNPHSIALHERTGLLLLADRENNHTRVLRARDGKDLGAFDCDLDFGAMGKPFGVRFYANAARQLDLAFVAIMDNPQDGRNQKIAVLDVSAAKPDAFACTRVEIIHVPTVDSGPHLLGVDYDTGDLYAALVADAPKSWVLRYKLLA